MIYISKIAILFCLLLNIFCNNLYAQKDLERYTQDFIIETKKINIPDYPHAFNPSIVKWKGKWLMSFRLIKETSQISSVCSASESEIGLIFLDNDFNPISTPQFIFFDHPHKKRAHLLAEDARLIVKNQMLYMTYSANKEEIIEDAGFRMYVAELDENKEGFFIINNECLANFDEANPTIREKNWVPFIYKNELLLAYYLFPHKIYRPLLNGSESCETVANSFSSFVWEWGELRGGTPALLLNDDYYIGFFHSWKYDSSVHSNNQLVPTYFMGAYLFSSSPPFEIKYISPEPIIGKNFYHGLTYDHYWHPVNVVFPSGLIVNENDLYVFYGRQDHEIWLTKLNKQELIDSLIHVSRLAKPIVGNI